MVCFYSLLDLCDMVFSVLPFCLCVSLNILFSFSVRAALVGFVLIRYE